VLRIEPVDDWASRLTVERGGGEALLVVQLALRGQCPPPGSARAIQRRSLVTATHAVTLHSASARLAAPSEASIGQTIQRRVVSSLYRRHPDIATTGLGGDVC